MSASYIPNAIEDALRPDGAPDGATDQPWNITTLGEADWTSRKISQARRKIAAAQAERDRIVARVDEWLERETKTADREASFFESKLIGWLQREIDGDPDGKKSRNLPSGAVVKRTGGRPSLTVTDETAFVDWLKDHRPDLVDEKVEFVWSKKDVRELATEDGEIAVADPKTAEKVVAPGVKVERGADSYTVVTP